MKSSSTLWFNVRKLSYTSFEESNTNSIIPLKDYHSEVIQDTTRLGRLSS